MQRLLRFLVVFRRDIFAPVTRSGLTVSEIYAKIIVMARMSNYQFPPFCNCPAARKLPPRPNLASKIEIENLVTILVNLTVYSLIR